MMEEKILVKSTTNRLLACLLAWGIPEALGITYFYIDKYSCSEETVIMVGIILIPLICGCIALWAFLKVELVITSLRIYGCASFGRRVDLPLDSVTAIGMCFMKGIAITTASGSIKFGCIKNRDEIYDVVSKLLMDRQTEHRSSMPQSYADELKKFKELLDAGIISQDEFDAKKKQLLGM